jgi:polyisoprenoid-binding protein YceI
MAITAGRLQFGPGNGRLLLFTRRQGVGSKVGHDLTIEVTDWSAQVDLATRPAVTARFDLGSLTVREGTGGVRPLTEQDRREIVKNARRSLGVDRYPTATFESTETAGSGEAATGLDGGTITGTLTVRGTAAPVEVRVRELAPDRYCATAVVKQSAHGIQPYSAFFGALKLRDEVAVEIEVDLTIREAV